ncbi:permease prefix domain 1-containing protein [Devosia sp. ZB163]|uniref:permease prefix domain 1-containing protein n=1 Tax=Devosia sp. ZB163 TaxID=3025938 RepID=UPI0023607441|nr:permease prefix domain 1-containing protein [Devosia sp. ZB163]MDC9822579.1 permease prefix domain 1-containing protein [Devosia sp. ZB163]
MRDPHSALGEELLRAGISPARVARYTAELDEHLADLTDELAATGLSPTEARAAALSRLGDHKTLAVSMLSQPGLRSLPSRVPALTWLMLPLLAQLGVIALLAVLLVAAGRHGLAPMGPAIVGPLLLLAPLVIAWSIAASALRRRAGVGWPLAGMLATLVAATALDLAIGPDAVAVSLGGPAPDVLALYALATIAPFLLLHRHLRVR